MNMYIYTIKYKQSNPLVNLVKKKKKILTAAAAAEYD